MSDVVLFCFGTAIFALTIVGAVMAGGLGFARIQLAENEDSRTESSNETGVPVVRRD